MRRTSALMVQSNTREMSNPPDIEVLQMGWMGCTLSGATACGFCTSGSYNGDCGHGFPQCATAPAWECRIDPSQSNQPPSPPPPLTPPPPPRPPMSPPPPPMPPTPPPPPECENSCYVAYDANCDDGGFGSEYNFCAMGTDCADCGTRYGGDAGSLG